MRGPILPNAPTLLEAGGLPARPDQHRDGKSFLAFAKNGKSDDGKTLFWHYPHYGNQGGAPGAAMLDGDWKLFVNHDGSNPELFNIPEDIGEERNVAAAHPETVKSLTARAVDWTKSLPPSPARDRIRETDRPQKTSGEAQSPKTKDKPNAAITPVQRALIFKKWDTDQDGRLSIQEYKAGIGEKQDAVQRFKYFDIDNDGLLTETEFVNAGKHELSQAKGVAF